MHGIFKRVANLRKLTGADAMVVLKQPDGSVFKRQIYHLLTTTDRAKFTSDMNDATKSRIRVHELPTVS